MGRTLYEKVYDAHVVNELSGEQILLQAGNLCVKYRKESI